ncbi:MAG: hypothetical protein R6W90_10680 [Ignavibacteriaceae bacterium]
MKKKMFFSLVVAALFAIGLSACGDNRTPDDTMDGTGMNDNTMMQDEGTQVTFWDENTDFTYTDREQYRESLNAAVDKLDDQIDRLEDRADNATGENKQMIEQRIDQLKERRSQIENRLNDWANITEDEWENFKSDINTAWNDVQDSFDQIARDLDLNDTEGQY